MNARSKRKSKLGSACSRGDAKIHGGERAQTKREERLKARGEPERLQERELREEAESAAVI